MVENKFGKASTFFQKSEALRPSLTNFDSQQNEPNNWIQKFEKTVLEASEMEDNENLYFCLLPFFLNPEDCIWFFSKRSVNNFSWEIFKSVFNSHFWQKYWK